MCQLHYQRLRCGEDEGLRALNADPRRPSSTATHGPPAPVRAAVPGLGPLPAAAATVVAVVAVVEPQQRTGGFDQPVPAPEPEPVVVPVVVQLLVVVPVAVVVAVFRGSCLRWAEWGQE